MTAPVRSMPPDRLPALLRQRELITQHLAWLDAEIAAAADGASSTPAEIPPPPPATTTAPLAAAPAAAPASSPDSSPEPDTARLAAANARANEILERYAATESFNPDATRRGCLLFAIATLLIGLVGLFVLYVLRYR